MLGNERYLTIPDTFRIWLWAWNGHLAPVPCASVLTAFYGRSAPMLGNERYLTIPDTFRIWLWAWNGHQVPRSLRFGAHGL